MKVTNKFYNQKRRELRAIKSFIIFWGSVVLALIIITGSEAWAKFAKGPVYGQIKFSDGRPASGVLVRAYDDDGQGDLNKNDKIGQTTTDANGNYTIPIESKHWDTDSLVSESWRPDVFITVLRNMGEWVKVGQSKVFDNKKHRESLRIDLSIPVDRWVSKATQFRPDTNGWRFDNFRANVCWPAKPICSDWSFCGGMSLSALTRFRKGTPIPYENTYSQKTITELKDSQLATMTNEVWQKFVEFTQSPTEIHTIAYHTIGFKTEKEIPKLRKAIDSGAPIILGIIRVKQDNLAEGVFKNHQVLAIGYRFNEGTGQMAIDVYDPNHNMKTSTIDLQTRAPKNQIYAKQTTIGGNPVVEKVRGFFVINIGSGPPKPVSATEPKAPAPKLEPVMKPAPKSLPPKTMPLPKAK